MLKMILLVPVIMACAAGGTIGLIKLIQKCSPDGELPKDSISRKLEEEAKRH